MHNKNLIFKKYICKTSQKQILSLYKTKSCEFDHKESYRWSANMNASAWFFLPFPAKYFLTGMLGTSERDGLYLSRRRQTKVLCKQTEPKHRAPLKTSTWNVRAEVKRETDAVLEERMEGWGQTEENHIAQRCLFQSSGALSSEEKHK